MRGPFLADSRPLSLGFVTPAWPAADTANGIASYIEAVRGPLVAMGHRVTIVSLSGQSSSADRADYSIAALRAERGWAEWAAEGVAFRLAAAETQQRQTRRLLRRATRRAIAEQGIEHLQIEDSFGHARGLAGRVAVPVTVRLHGPWFLNGRALGVPEDARFHHRVREEGLGIAAADGVQAVSLDVLKRVRAHYGLDLPKAEVVPAPVPLPPPDQRWRSERRDPGLVLFVGRFDRHKGGDLVIEAFARALRGAPEARLMFVGPDPGTYRDEGGRPRTIEEFVRERLPGALESGRVQWMGLQPLSALAEFRRRAALVVIASRYENLARTVIEAAALGCPIVAARTGGIPEAIADGTNGLLFRPGDVDDLAAKILELLSDPAKAARLGARAAADFERRSHPDRIAERMVAFYRRAIEGWRQAPREDWARGKATADGGVPPMWKATDGGAPREWAGAARRSEDS